MGRRKGAPAPANSAKGKQGMFTTVTTMDSFLKRAASVLDKEIELVNRRISRSPNNPQRLRAHEIEVPEAPVGSFTRGHCSSPNMSLQEDTSGDSENDAGTSILLSTCVDAPILVAPLSPVVVISSKTGVGKDCKEADVSSLCITVKLPPATPREKVVQTPKGSMQLRGGTKRQIQSTGGQSKTFKTSLGAQLPNPPVSSPITPSTLDLAGMLATLQVSLSNLLDAKLGPIIERLTRIEEHISLHIRKPISLLAGDLNPDPGQNTPRASGTRIIQVTSQPPSIVPHLNHPLSSSEALVRHEDRTAATGSSRVTSACGSGGGPSSAPGSCHQARKGNSENSEKQQANLPVIDLPPECTPYVVVLGNVPSLPRGGY